MDNLDMKRYPRKERIYLLGMLYKKYHQDYLIDRQDIVYKTHRLRMNQPGMNCIYLRQLTMFHLLDMRYMMNFQYSRFIKS